MAIARGEITITELYDGDNFYRAWADTPDGSGSSFTTEESDRAYLGVYSGREEPTHYSQYKWSRIRGESAITAILSNDSHQVGTDENGNYGNYTGAKTTVAVFHGGEDDTSNWEINSIQVEPTGAVTGKIIDTYTYKVEDLKADEASVTFNLTHKKGEYSPLEKTFTLSKNKQGISGQHATSYFLSFNDTAIKKFRETMTMEPSELVMQGMSIKADQKPAPQSGYFKIYEQSEVALDRDQYEQAYIDNKLDEEELYVISEKNYPLILTYTSKEPEERLTYEYTDLEHIMSIKVYWYLDPEFEELIDVQTISITSDGEKGDPGENAPLVKISGDTQVIKISEDGTKTPNSNFTVIGKSLNTDIEKWEYSINGGSFSTNTPVGVTRSDDIVMINPRTINFNTLSIQATGASVSDTFTIAQMTDGLNAYTVLLSNESHTFQADTQKAVASNTTTGILAYKGTKKIPVTVQSVTGLPTGMTHSVNNNGKDNASITFNATASLSSPSGLVSINLLVDGQQMTKEFSYALSFKGDTGEAGKDAISAVLTNESITFAADKDGVVQNYVGNTGSFLLMEGTVNKSAETDFEKVSQTNVSAEIDKDNGSYTIYSMTNGTSATTGQATFRATYKGIVIDKTVTISKSIAGQTGGKGDPGAPGGKGDPGAPATSYWLTASVDTVTVKYNGDYDPKTITYYGHSKTGSNNTQNYSGRFIVQTSIDGVNFTEAYRSPVDMNKVDFSVLEDALFIKAKFYQAGGTTYLLDEQTTPILHSADGLKGVGLEDKDYQVSTEIYTDKADDSVVHVEIDGKSYQHAGSGKNLFDIRQHTYSSTITPNEWGGFDRSGGYGSVSASNIKVKPNQTYIFSYKVEYGSARQEIRDGDGSILYVLGTGRGISFTPKHSTISINMSNMSAHNDVDSRITEIQLEEGSTATEYEPPAPNPDYPIEIHSLNDFDVVSQKSEGGTIDGTEFGGRNLVIRNNEILDRYINVSGGVSFGAGHSTMGSLIPVSPDETLTFSMILSELQNPSWWRFKWLDSEGEFISRTAISATDEPVFQWKVPSNAYFIQVSYPTDSFPQIERGNIATDWIPAPEDITENDNHPLIDKMNLSLSKLLRSAGDVKDRLFRDSDGLWKIERNIGEYTTDGTDNWHTGASSGGWNVSGSTRAFYSSTLLNKMKPARTINATTNRFTVGRNSTNGIVGSDNEEFSLGYASWGVIFRIKKSRLITDDTTGFKDWIANNPVTIVYELANSATETLDQEFQDKLNNLRSFQDSNYVYTIINNKTDIIAKGLKPNLRATFKGGGYYARWKTAYDLEKTTEYIEQEIKRTQNTAWIRAGMRIGYSSFTQTNPNSVYICGLEYRDGYRDMVLVDKPAEIYVRDSEQTDTIPNQALSVSGVPAGTTAYIIWDNTKKELFFIYYESVMTSTGVLRKRWRNISGQTIEFTDSLFAIGEVEV